LEHTRINVMKTLIMDSIDADQELASRKLKLVQELKGNVECIDARKDVDYFIKSNQSPPTGSWASVSGNIGRVISKDLFPDDDNEKSGNPMYSGYLPGNSRARLRSKNNRPDSLQVQKHYSGTTRSPISSSGNGSNNSRDHLAQSWTQFQQHVTNEHSLHHPDLASSDQYHHSTSEHRFQERSSNLSTASSVRSQKPTKSAPTPPSSEDEVEV